ncbi:MAG TPA: AAA family ATPase [Propionibacteriaceae bacterium]|nr:AAA family ATPase [Propionibacteriaceae bacterium]
MRLLEREHAFEVLRTSAHQAFQGHGCVVLVAGEAGVGKTVLLRTFREQVLGQARVLWGMCDSLSTPRPLSPLRDVADELGSSVPSVLQAAVAPYEIFSAVLDALRSGPRMLVVEDLHWADEASLDLVRFLARRIATLPLLLVLSYRDALAVNHPLSAVLGDLVTSPDSRRLQLSPLSRSAVADMVSGHELDAVDVYRRTAGNPYFVSQILAQPDSSLPETVRDAVLARTAKLTPSARHVLELLSCTPEAVTGELLAALGVTAGTVDVLATTGLIERHGRGLTFRHEIARSAVLGAVTAGSEPALHADMIDALERIDGDPSVLAHHAAAAGDIARILQYAPVAAADAARSGAHREAVSLYEAALACADLDPATQSDLLESVSVELYLTDRLSDAITARERALRLRQQLGDTVAVGVAHSAMSGFAWYAADRAAAEEHARASLEILSATDDQQAIGFALAHFAFLAAQRGDTVEAHASADRAERTADLFDDVVLRGTAWIGRGIARLVDGDVRGRADLITATEVGLQERVDDLATTPMSNLCHFDVEQGRFADAEQSVAYALRISEERDTPICTAWQLGVRARLRLLQGRWTEAEQDAREVLNSVDLPLSQLWPHYVLGLLAARRDAPPENPHLDSLWRLVNRLDNPGKVAPAAAALAEQAWISRRPDPRLDEDLVSELFTRSYAGKDAVLAPLRRWSRRLGAAGLPSVGPPTEAIEPGPSDQPFERALALWDAGSTDELLAALALLDPLGARAVAALVRARLRADGVSSVPRGMLPATRAHPAGLTARQQEVLTLLADGLSNADIAARLVISPKTADHHVSAILTKLDVHSRGEAAALARRLLV